MEVHMNNLTSLHKSEAALQMSQTQASTAGVEGEGGILATAACLCDFIASLF